MEQGGKPSFPGSAFLVLILLLVLIPIWACRDDDPTGVSAGPAPAPSEFRDWDAWLKLNARSLSSLDSEDFSDLQFLKSVIGDERLVQLGESGHGVAEFNKVKVRLIKFLHQEMGFDVIAFESSIYECFRADRGADTLSAEELMSTCIYHVWHTREVVPLFEYIKETKKGDRPLTLAGFDMKPSSGAYADRGDFLTGVVQSLDPDLASDVEAWERALIPAGSPWLSKERLSRESERLRPNYEALLDWFDAHEADLRERYATDPAIPLIARQLVYSTTALSKMLVKSTQPDRDCGATRIRDHAMAGNFTRLIRAIYPDRKVIVWAHNYHIRHDNRHTEYANYWMQPSGQFGCETMGEEIFTRHDAREGQYTLGLYMYEGMAANNVRELYSIKDPDPRSLEAFLVRAGHPQFVLDLRGSPPDSVPPWLRSSVPVREWGVGYLLMVPRDQYDGILFIETVSPPDYIPGSGTPVSWIY